VPVLPLEGGAACTPAASRPSTASSTTAVRARAIMRDVEGAGREASHLPRPAVQVALTTLEPGGLDRCLPAKLSTTRGIGHCTQDQVSPIGV
jgi:hypothetical protein